MAKYIYNEGRVVGYSAYELYVKQSLAEDPNTPPVSEKEWLAATLGSGSSLLLKFPKQSAASNSATNIIDIPLPANSALCAASTVVATFFRGEGNLLNSYFAKNVKNYGNLLLNNSTQFPKNSNTITSTNSPSQNTNWSDSELNQLKNYCKVIDGLVIQPGIWNPTQLPEPFRELKFVLANKPTLRFLVRGTIDTNFWMLLTGFTYRGVILGETGVDTSVNTTSPQNGDYLGPATYPWANKICFTVPSSVMSYFFNTGYIRKLPKTENPAVEIDTSPILDFSQPNVDQFYKKKDQDSNREKAKLTNEETVVEVNSINKGDSVLTLYNKDTTHEFPPALYTHIAKEPGNVTLTPSDTIAPGTIKMFDGRIYSSMNIASLLKKGERYKSLFHDNHYIVRDKDTGKIYIDSEEPIGQFKNFDYFDIHFSHYKTESGNTQLWKNVILSVFTWHEDGEPINVIGVLHCDRGDLTDKCLIQAGKKAIQSLNIKDEKSKKDFKRLRTLLTADIKTEELSKYTLKVNLGPVPVYQENSTDTIGGLAWTNPSTIGYPLSICTFGIQIKDDGNAKFVYTNPDSETTNSDGQTIYGSINVKPVDFPCSVELYKDQSNDTGNIYYTGSLKTTGNAYPDKDEASGQNNRYYPLGNKNEEYKFNPNANHKFHEATIGSCYIVEGQHNRCSVNKNGIPSGEPIEDVNKSTFYTERVYKAKHSYQCCSDYITKDEYDTLPLIDKALFPYYKNTYDKTENPRGDNNYYCKPMYLPIGYLQGQYSTMPDSWSQLDTDVNGPGGYGNSGIQMNAAAWALMPGSGVDTLFNPLNLKSPITGNSLFDGYDKGDYPAKGRFTFDECYLQFRFKIGYPTPSYGGDRTPSSKSKYIYQCSPSFLRPMNILITTNHKYYGTTILGNSIPTPDGKVKQQEKTITDYLDSKLNGIGINPKYYVINDYTTGTSCNYNLYIGPEKISEQEDVVTFQAQFLNDNFCSIWDGKNFSEYRSEKLIDQTVSKANKTNPIVISQNEPAYPGCLDTADNPYATSYGNDLAYDYCMYELYFTDQYKKMTDMWLGNGDYRGDEDFFKNLVMMICPDINVRCNELYGNSPEFSRGGICIQGINLKVVKYK